MRLVLLLSLPSVIIIGPFSLMNGNYEINMTIVNAVGPYI
jgi:hypothetical protein